MCQSMHFTFVVPFAQIPKNVSNIDKAFKLKKASRIILIEHNTMTSSNILFRELRWMFISDYLIYIEAILVRKVPRNFSGKF